MAVQRDRGIGIHVSDKDPKSEKDPTIEADLAAMRLPRGGIGWAVSRGQMIKILFTAGILALVIVVQRPCSDAVSGFVTDFDNPGSAAAQMPRPDNVDVPVEKKPAIRTDDEPAYYESIKPGMSEAEIKAAIERARARAREGREPQFTAELWFDWPAMFANAAGSAAGPGSGAAGSGTATP